MSNAHISIPDDAEFYTSVNHNKGAYTIDIPKGKLVFIPHFLDENYCQQLLNLLTDNNLGLGFNSNWKEIYKTLSEKIIFKNIHWHQDKLKMYGKSVLAPRLTSWYADSGLCYRYSGQTLEPNPWNDILLNLKQKIETTLNCGFNSVLLNWYRDGKDYMGWHADNEKELGTNPSIASLNLGASRRFILRNNENKKSKVEVILNQGSLLLMSEATQHYWQHTIPKSTKIKEGRINLTFRSIVR